MERGHFGVPVFVWGINRSSGALKRIISTAVVQLFPGILAVDGQKFHATWAPRMLSIMRIAISLLFLEHGSQKLFGIPGTQPFHAPPEFSLPWIAGVLEFFGGTLLLFGLFTRIVAFTLSGEMAVAYIMVHFPHGLSPLINRGELAVRDFVKDRPPATDRNTRRPSAHPPSGGNIRLYPTFPKHGFRNMQQLLLFGQAQDSA